MASNSKQVIHAYLTSKGVNVNPDWSALEWVQSALLEEHPGLNHPAFTSAKKATLESIGVARVHLLDRVRYEATEAKKIEGSPKIAGVLVPAGSAYLLLDGYGRLKGLNQRNAISATYIVLH